MRVSKKQTAKRVKIRTVGTSDYTIVIIEIKVIRAIVGWKMRWWQMGQ